MENFAAEIFRVNERLRQKRTSDGLSELVTATILLGYGKTINDQLLARAISDGIRAARNYVHINRPEK